MVAQDYEDDAAPHSVDGTLRGPPSNLKRGDLVLSIFVEKWGFKDADVYVEPRVVVSVRDRSGASIEAIQVRAGRRRGC